MSDLVCICSFASRSLAETARCALEAGGVQASVIAEDAAYDIALARGGAQLLVREDAVMEAQRILAHLGAATHDDTDDATDGTATPETLRFSLSRLFALTTFSAFCAAGYAYNRLAGAMGFAGFFVLAIVGTHVLLSVPRRRRSRKLFVAVAGIGFILYGLQWLIGGLVP